MKTGLYRQAVDRLREVREVSGENEIIVSFSGGKDSIATLQLCVDTFERVHAFFCYIVPGLDVEERSLRATEKRFGIVVHRLPNPALQHYLRGANYLPRPVDFRRRYKDADVYRTIRSRTGARLIAFGYRMDESLQRRGMIKSHEGFDEHLGKVYPLWNWNARSVYAYLRFRKLMPLVVDSGGWDTGGIGINPTGLAYLSKHHPLDYEKILRIFPLASAGVMREEQRDEIDDEEENQDDHQASRSGSR